MMRNQVCGNSSANAATSAAKDDGSSKTAPQRPVSWAMSTISRAPEAISRSTSSAICSYGKLW